MNSKVSSPKYIYHNLKPKKYHSSSKVEKGFTTSGVVESQLGKIYQSFNIDQLMFANGKVISLAKAQQSTLQINSQAITLFSQYFNYNINFICIVGNKFNDNLLFSDKIIKKFKVSGQKFKKFIQNNKVHNQVTFWSAPFQKGNMKIYLMNLNSISNSNEQKILINFIITISSTIILIHPHLNIQKIHKIIQQTTTKSNHSTKISFYLISNNTKIIKSSKQSFFELSGSVKIKYIQEFTQTQQIKILQFFKQIYQNITYIQISDIKINGKILIQLINIFLKRNNQGKQLNIQFIIQDIYEQLYLSAYNNSIIKYNQKLQNQLSDDKPIKLQILISILKKVNQEIMSQFYQLNNKYQVMQKYSTKLLQYIQHKQKIIFEINERKNLVDFQKCCESINTTKNINDNIENIKLAASLYNTGIINSLGKNLKFIYNQHKKNIQVQKQKIQFLQNQVKSKSSTLYQIKSPKYLEVPNQRKKINQNSQKEIKLQNNQIKEKMKIIQQLQQKILNNKKIINTLSSNDYTSISVNVLQLKQKIANVKRLQNQKRQQMEMVRVSQKKIAKK